MDRLPIYFFVVLTAACGEDDCPAGTVRTGGRCVLPDEDGGPGCEDITYHRDADDDGFGTDGDVVCEPTDGYVEPPGDCDDSDPDVHPGAEEACNGIDDDCADGPDTALGCVQNAVSDCTTECKSTGTITCSAKCEPGDCVPPEEICNGLDDDCDEQVDEGDLYALETPVQVSQSSADDAAPDLVWTGTDFLLVWEDDESGVNEMRWARVAGGEVEPAGGEYLQPWPGSDSFRPRIAMMGADAVLTFNNSGPNGHVLGCVLDAAAPALDHCVLINDPGVPPWVTATYSAGLAASEDIAAIGFVYDVSEPSPYDATVALVDSEPQEVANERIVGDSNREGPCSVAYDPVRELFALVWAGEREIWAGQVNPIGDEDGIEEAVATSVVADVLYGPSVAWGVDTGLVAYIRMLGGGVQDLEVVEINGAAIPAGSDPIVIGHSGPGPLQDHPLDLESTGNGYVLSYYDADTGRTAVVRLTSEGAMVDAPIAASPAGATVGPSAVAWNGTDVGVAWVDDSGEGGDVDVWFGMLTCR